MLRDQIKSDLQQAQLQRDEIKISTLRLLLSAISYADIANNVRTSGEEISDDEILTVIQKEVKRRYEAATGFRQGNREESAQKEEMEAKILEVYLPEQLSDEELTKIIEETITEVRAKSMADMGRVIGMVMGKVKGLANGGKVSQIVKEKLQETN